MQPLLFSKLQNHASRLLTDELHYMVSKSTENRCIIIGKSIYNIIIT